MKSSNELMQEIIRLTAEIETKYPELYIHLGETPCSLSETNQKEIAADDLKKYLETLKSQLKHQLETHENPVK